MLDAGCGVGGVTRALVARGARVVALDIGPKLAAEARARCGCPAVVGTLAAPGFASNSFDVVFSSEAIEHTPDPRRSVWSCTGRASPAGISCCRCQIGCGRRRCAPRRDRAAAVRRLREFSVALQLRAVLEQAGAEVVEHRGLHLWPFQIKRLRDSHAGWTVRRALLPLMINQCMHGRKPQDAVRRISHRTTVNMCGRAARDRTALPWILVSRKRPRCRSAH